MISLFFSNTLREIYFEDLGKRMIKEENSKI